jgi:hypothetical protein
MGFASDGGLLKLDFRDSIGDWAITDDGRIAKAAAMSTRACGNLEEKGTMVWITPAL